jgi:SynChlorMet cassette radical SAM/SPASM protein ScmE
LALVDGIVANRMRFSVLTNGSLLTPQLATALKATGRCNHVQVSLDGSTAAVHESLRGAGTFEPALNAIRTLQKTDLPVTVRVTVHPGNVEDLPAITRLLLEELGLPSFSTNSTSSLVTSEKYGPEVFLPPKQYLRAMQLLAELDAQYSGRIQASAGPLADWHSFNAMESARKSGKPIAGRGRLVGCGCIFDRLAIRADGYIIPCVMLPQMVLGRIGKDDLADIWQQAEALNGLRERTRIGLGTFVECQTCAWHESCTGNCPGTAYSMTGEVNRPCPATCLKRFQKDLANQGLSLWP